MSLTPLSPPHDLRAGVLDRLERIMVPAAGAQSVFLGALSRMQVRHMR